jgi:hypothetical protein
MVRIDRFSALLIVVGLLAATNSFWLLPNANTPNYTYERAEITVTNGTFEYDGMWSDEFHHENDLVSIGCQPPDGNGRACALDRHIVADGPVTVEGDGADTAPEYVELGGAYYRRNESGSDAETTYGLDRVSPDELLAGVATNLTGIPARSVPEDEWSPHEIAVVEEPVTTTKRLDADELGRVYRRDGTYYTVVLTDSVVPRYPLLTRGTRALLLLVGPALVVAALVRIVGRHEDGTA